MCCVLPNNDLVLSCLQPAVEPGPGLEQIARCTLLRAKQAVTRFRPLSRLCCYGRDDIP
jgi:hypothetical protein